MLLHNVGQSEMLKLCDFGYSKDDGLGTEASGCKTACGTPEYMAPEVRTGRNLINLQMLTTALTVGVPLTALLVCYAKAARCQNRLSASSTRYLTVHEPCKTMLQSLGSASVILCCR